MTRLLAALATVLLALAGVFAWTMAGAQEDDTAEKGRFTRFVEDTISTPDRKISLGSIDGVLSSDVRIDRITIADRDGVTPPAHARRSGYAEMVRILEAVGAR